MIRYTVRAARECDVPRMCALEKECFSSPWSAKAFEDTLAQSGAGFFVCEDDGGEILGYVGTLCVFDECSLLNVCVSNSHRKMGVGRALVTAAEENAKRLGASSVFLEVRVSNENAISLYEKLGYDRITTRRGFYSKPREDAYVYKKEL